MLISCNSCNSKYLINSADLKPEGKMVECAKCGNQWFQDITTKPENINNLSRDNQKIDSKSNSLPTPNLPSTYVQKEQFSILNSILVILFIIILIFGFWFVQNFKVNTLVLIKFYMHEFYFNLKLIIFDIVSIVYRIFN